MKAGKDYIGVDCGALILNKNEEALFLKRSGKSKNQAGWWSQPGGTVEFGEKIEDAIRHEIKEELDLDIELKGLLCYTDHILAEENQHWAAISYAAKIHKGMPKIMEPEKIEEIKWFKLDRLPEKLAETTLDAVKAYLKKQKCP